MQTQNETIQIEKNGKVFLILPNKKFKSKRMIGYIRNRTFCTKRKENHLYREYNAFGLNYKLLNEGGKHFDNIQIEYDFKILETSLRYYLANGKFKHYQQNNLEKQIFLPLELYGLDRVEVWEKDQAKKHCVVKSEKTKLVIQFAMF